MYSYKLSFPDYKVKRVIDSQILVTEKKNMRVKKKTKTPITWFCGLSNQEFQALFCVFAVHEIWKFAEP